MHKIDLLKLCPPYPYHKPSKVYYITFVLKQKLQIAWVNEYIDETIKWVSNIIEKYPTILQNCENPEDAQFVFTILQDRLIAYETTYKLYRKLIVTRLNSSRSQYSDIFLSIVNIDKMNITAEHIMRSSLLAISLFIPQGEELKNV